MDDIPIDKIVRSRRRTLALIVTPDARLVVRAPLKAPAATIEAFVRQQEGWIRRKMAEMKDRPPAVVHAYAEGEVFWFLGRSYPLFLTDEPGGAIRRTDRLCVPRTIAPDIPRAIHEWYRKEALGE